MLTYFRARYVKYFAKVMHSLRRMPSSSFNNSIHQSIYSSSHDLSSEHGSNLITDTGVTSYPYSPTTFTSSTFSLPFPFPPTFRYPCKLLHHIVLRPLPSYIPFTPSIEILNACNWPYTMVFSTYPSKQYDPNSSKEITIYVDRYLEGGMLLKSYFFYQPSI
jgi:hypothetical protein